MSGGFRVDPDALDRAGKRIGALRAKVDAAEKKVTEADVPMIAWGVLGTITTQSACYSALISDLHDCMKRATEGVTRAGDKLKSCGAAYRDSDTNTRDAVLKLVKELETMNRPQGD